MSNICQRCGKVHNSPPVDPDKIVASRADELAKEIDRQVMESFQLSTHEKQSEFNRKRNYPKVIIAGGRDYHNYDTLLEAIEESGFLVGAVVSGGANGVDALGERYAVEMNLNLHIYNADWETHGRAAGPIRNRKMAENADALIALWDGKSRGTKNMIETATKKGLRVYVKRYA